MALTALIGELSLAADLVASLEAIPGAMTALVNGARQSRAGARTVVSTFTGAAALSQARTAWQTLELAGGRTTPFQSLAVAEAAAEVHLRKGETPLIATVYRDDRPVVLFPAVIGRFLGAPAIRFLGDPFIQYGDMLAASSARPEDFAAAWRAVCQSRHACFVQLRKVRRDARAAAFLDTLRATVIADAAPWVDLAGPPAMASRDVRELRRSRRRLGEQGTVSFHVFHDEDALPALATALAHKRAWLAERGLTSPVVGDGSWEDVFARLARTPGAVRLAAAQLCLDGRPIATEIALDDGARWCAYLGAIDPRSAAFGPGRLQMADTIARCASAGRRVYDLLAPADSYKKSLATDACEVRDYAVTLGLQGRIGLAAIRLAPAIKARLMRLPPGPRAAILGWLRGLRS